MEISTKKQDCLSLFLQMVLQVKLQWSWMNQVVNHVGIWRIHFVFHIALSQVVEYFIFLQTKLYQHLHLLNSLKPQNLI